MGLIGRLLYFTKKNWAGCFTQEELSKILDYQRAGDTAAIQRLLDLKRCFLVKEDLPVYVVETGLRIIKIRPKGHTLELYMLREALK
jgi:hypothetical protein